MNRHERASIKKTFSTTALGYQVKRAIQGTRRKVEVVRLLDDGERLGGATVAVEGVEEGAGAVGGKASGVVGVIGREDEGSLATDLEGLRVSSSTLTIGTTAAGEEDDSVTGSTTRIEVEATLGEGADDERGSGDVVVLATGDDVELLVGASGAVFDRDGDQFLSEVSSLGVDEEALPAVGTDGDAGEGPGGGVVPLVGFGSSTGLERTTSARDRDGGRRVKGEDAGGVGPRASIVNGSGSGSGGNSVGGGAS
jgi:hypothetical protein